MKKNLLIYIINIICILVFIACEDGIGNDRSWEQARVDVVVRNQSNVPIVGEYVYMFRDLEPDEDTDIGIANRVVVTDENGVAEFDLNFEDLNISTDVTRFYFALYKYMDENMLFVRYDDYITVESGEVKTIYLTVPDEV